MSTNTTVTELRNARGLALTKIADTKRAKNEAEAAISIASDKLAEIQSEARAGEDITPQRLANAHAAIELATLRHEGTARKAAQALRSVPADPMPSVVVLDALQAAGSELGITSWELSAGPVRATDKPGIVGYVWPGKDGKVNAVDGVTHDAEVTAAVFGLGAMSVDPAAFVAAIEASQSADRVTVDSYGNELRITLGSAYEPVPTLSLGVPEYRRNQGFSFGVGDAFYLPSQREHFAWIDRAERATQWDISEPDADGIVTVKVEQAMRVTIADGAPLDRGQIHKRMAERAEQLAGEPFAGVGRAKWVKLTFSKDGPTLTAELQHKRG